jgi:hypothetical protein
VGPGVSTARAPARAWTVPDPAEFRPLIDTKTMTIVDVMTGAPDSACFQAKVAPLCP